MSDAEERAAAGARLLDREVPGWIYEVDLDDPDLGRALELLLVRLLGAVEETIIPAGTAAWQREIAARRAKP